MAITQIKIYKRTSLLWSIYDNTQPSENIEDNRISSNYSAESIGDYVTIKTKTGGIMYEKVHYSIVTYIDTIDNANNFTPTSAGDLIAKLKLQGFFGTEENQSGGVFLFKELSDTFSSFAGYDGQVLMIDEATNKVKPYNLGAFDQNNVGLYLFFGELAGTGDVTPEDASNFLNSQQYAITVSPTRTPVTFGFTRNGKRYIFLFTPGKGLWGAASGNNEAGTVSANHFVLISVYNLIPEDIDDYPGATIIDLGTLATGDYLTAANSAERDFSNAGTIDENGNVQTYYFSYTTNNVLYFVQFIGDAGTYNGTLTSSDFVSSTNTNVASPQVDSGGIKILFNDNTQSPTITGSTVNVIIATKTIPAGTIQTGDYGELVVLFNKNINSASSVSYRFYLGTTGTTSGDTMIGFTQGEITQQKTEMTRPLYFTEDSLKTVNFSSYAKSTLYNANSSNAYDTLAVNWGVDQILSVAIKLDNAADSAYLENFLLRINNRRLEI